MVAAVFLFTFLLLDSRVLSSSPRNDRELLLTFGLGAIITVLLLAVVLTSLGPAGYLRSWQKTLKRRKLTRKVAMLVRARVLRPDLLFHLSMNLEGLTERHEVYDSEEGVIVRYSVEVRVAWSAVSDIERTDDHLFLTVPALKQSVILPRRAFPDQETFQRFADRVIDYRRAAPERPVPAFVAKTKPQTTTAGTRQPDVRITKDL
jgi:YcxB-like protein